MDYRPQSRGYGMQDPPQTGMRTANLRTSAGPQQVNYGGVGLNTNITMSERPVTQQGMVGMRVKTAGPGRQVQDTSYYATLLRNKCLELQSETEKLNKEIAQFESDNSSYVKYERMYESLIKEVGDLERRLADYNLAMDKARDNTDPEDVEYYKQQLEQRNQEEKNAIDSIFLERQSQERAVAEIQQQIKRLQAITEHKITQLSPDDRARYNQLQAEEEHLGQRISQLSSELEDLKAQARHHEAALERDRYRETYTSLSKQLEKLKKEHDDLEEEVQTLKMDPEEARQRLMEKVKRENAKIKETQDKIELEREEIHRQQKQLAELQLEIDERNANGDSQRFVFQRDEEMSKFIESYEEVKFKEIEDQHRAKKMIVALLKHTSSYIETERNLPSTQGYRDLQEGVSAKTKHLQSSQSTQQQLELELENKKRDFEKIKTLQPKIEAELDSIEKKMDTMRKEIVSFEDLDYLRETAAMTNKTLSKLRREYAARKESIKAQVARLSSRFEKKKNLLAENDTAKALEGLEQKLRHYEQNIFHLQEFIDEKNREQDFQSQKEDCGRIIDELNLQNINAASNQQTITSGF